MCRFSLAVNRSYKDKTTRDWKELATFVPVVVWREAAERCQERLPKGSPVQVEGRLVSRDFEDKTGQKRTVLEVEARQVQFLASGPAASGSGEGGRASGEASQLKDGGGAGAPQETQGEDLEEVPF